MKKILAILTFVFCVSVAGTSFAADPTVGYWKSVDEQGKVTAGWQIYEVNGQLRGKILAVAGYPRTVIADKVKASYKGYPFKVALNTQPTCGTVWIWGVKRKSAGVWKGGQIIDPNDGKMYTCNITFHKKGGKFKADTLEMRGKVGPFGRSQFWVKSSLAEINAIK